MSFTSSARTVQAQVFCPEREAAAAPMSLRGVSHLQTLRPYRLTHLVHCLGATHCPLIKMHCKQFTCLLASVSRHKETKLTEPGLIRWDTSASWLLCFSFNEAKLVSLTTLFTVKMVIVLFCCSENATLDSKWTSKIIVLLTAYLWRICIHEFELDDRDLSHCFCNGEYASLVD